MTAVEMAEKLGVSRATLYRKASENGVNMADLRDAAGQLSTEGIQTLAALFDGNKTEHEAQKRQAEKDIHDIEKELIAVRGKLEAAERENALLRQMVEDWKAQAQQAQQMQAATMQLIPAKAGFFNRVLSAVLKRQ